jgi:biotin carboxyl carrier protein
MKKYLITVKGITYEVEVEELRENEQTQPKPRQGEIQTSASETQAPKASAPRQAPKTGGKTVTSPMPGSIFKVNVKPGEAVKKGDIILILEAMKMENEIFAAEDAVVASVEATEGATVNTGDILVTFE